MSDEKPLHVRVAEALGVTRVEQCGSSWTGFHGVYPNGWIATCGEDDPCAHDLDSVPDYDTDWSATGPLIEKYGIDIVSHAVVGWTAGRGRFSEIEPCVHEWDADGKTPLQAVCYLILALKEAGKL